MYPLVRTNNMTKRKPKEVKNLHHPEKNPRIGIPCCKIRKPVLPVSIMLFQEFAFYLGPTSLQYARLQLQLAHPDFLAVLLCLTILPVTAPVSKLKMRQTSWATPKPSDVFD